MIDYKTIGERIRKRRLACNLSQEKLAEICDVGTTVYCIIKIPTIAEGNPQSCMRIFPIIADVFGISLGPQ